METRKPNKGMKIEEKERKAAGLDTAVLRERGKTALREGSSNSDRKIVENYEITIVTNTALSTTKT